MPADPLVTLAALPDVAGAVEGARAAVDRLRRHRVLRARAGQVCAESALRGARASAALEGADLALEDVRRLAGPPSGATEAVLAGALRATAEVGSLAPVWRRSPLQTLARLHVLAAADLTSAAALGRPVRGGPRLAALAELVTERPSGARLPAVVEAALVHAELYALAPFGVADGVVARAASRVVLVARGLDPGSLAIPELGHLESADYRERLAGYAAGDVAGWVRHCADALARGAQEGIAVCEAVLRAG